MNPIETKPGAAAAAPGASAPAAGLGTTSVIAVVRNGRIDIAAPDAMPEGMRVSVSVAPLPAGSPKVGLDESEWRDDPESLADWDQWIRSFEPMEFSAEEEETHRKFSEEVRRVSIEEIRKQMNEGI